MTNDSTSNLMGGRYEILELAGDGGMARVYRAVTRGAAGFQRQVAIKRVHEHLAGSTEFVRMFIEEARFESAEVMGRELLRVIGHEPVSARELGHSVIEARVALGLTPRSIRPPASPGPVQSREVVMHRMVVIKPPDGGQGG